MNVTITTTSVTVTVGGIICSIVTHRHTRGRRNDGSVAVVTTTVGDVILIRHRSGDSFVFVVGISNSSSMIMIIIMVQRW